ncbi:hypothetical protein H3N89_gp61 [Microbacterium phage MonChoix]|uniref:Uncharacterized protein n=1 Tax=Microbacterium phage MonChoix TaxID=2590880 RepID=A0A4Y6EBH0_9CAUD|nr:hypothetical protein H3N89_gp61 [Microbacterium phage MonChoix]QDF16028.1 hypothetical protein SEA_MONCHOIX_61 [Microbacterium phage MonChoix]
MSERAGGGSEDTVRESSRAVLVGLRGEGGVCPCPLSPRLLLRSSSGSLEVFLSSFRRACAFT